MEFRGIKLNVDFRPGNGDVNALPTGHGIYAQIHWPTQSIRIGESKAVRSRNRGHIRWAEKHKSGTHSPNEANRNGIIVDHAKLYGFDGSECYLISDDARLADREFRVECEKFLHDWARTQNIYRNLNTQRGYRTVN